MRYGQQRGFTLIELLVVVLIMATIGSVIAACFMGGMRVYRQVYEFAQGESDVYLAFEQIERDLVNAVRVRDIPFVGEPDIMQFAALDPISDGDGSGGDVNVVRYRYDAVDGVVRGVHRLDADQFITEEDVGRGMSDVRFYYSNEPFGGDESWSDQWQSVTGLPRRVRIWMQFDSGDQGHFERVILLPTESAKMQEKK
jgi:prepilin-type N-terminal cleavage/methylation domain-containing protein